jgi:membrane fusion protein (multidrug efflux system)
MEMQSLMARSLVLFALLIPAAGCGVRASRAESSPGAEAAVSVETVVAGSREVPRTITLTGTLLARRESAVAADANGKVISVAVERGQDVKKGAPLVRLDRRAAALVDAEASAQAAAADRQRSLAELECARAERLFAGGAINQAEHDRATAQCESARHTAAAANARRRMADKNLGDAVVKAPFSGVVAERLVNEGEYVRADSRVATIVDLDELKLELSVPETAIAALQPGAQVDFRVASFPGETFHARVKLIGAAVRRASRDLIVEATLANPGRKLRPGMFAVAEVAVGRNTLPVVPASALREAEGAQRVFVVVGGRVQERLVRVASRDGEVAAVLSGLETGERVVRAPRPELRDGLKVR